MPNRPNGEIVRKISLTTLILLMTVAALAIALFSLSWRLRSAEHRLVLSEARRFTGWPDPDGVSALALNQGGKAFRPTPKLANLGWKLQLPSDRTYELHWESFGGPTRSGVAEPSLLSGQSAISVRLSALENADLLLSWGNESLSVIKQPTQPGSVRFSSPRVPEQHTIRLTEAGQLFHLRGYSISITGLNDTESGDASAPFTLLEIEEAIVKDGKPRGFRLWIEPTQTDASR